MATTLTGGTLIGDGIGTITGIQSCTVGGLEVNDINFAANDDTNGVTNHIPGTATEGPITVTIVYTSTLQNTLRNAADDRDIAETFTYIDGAGAAADWKWSGLGFISAVSGVDSDPDSEDTFTMTITPVTKFTFAEDVE